MSTHTPGPWHWQDRYDFREHKEHQKQGLDANCENIRDGRMQLMAGDDVVLQEWGATDDGGVEISMADARLIEAAPDLLAALKALLANEDIRYACDMGPRYEGWQSDAVISLFARAEDAIKKAEGR
jgi:hypothetical protein